MPKNFLPSIDGDRKNFPSRYNFSLRTNGLASLLIERQGETLSHKEHDRTATLAAFQIFGTPPEPEFDRLARLALNLGQTKAAFICFMDAQEMHVKACEGTTVLSFCKREDTICNRVVASGASVEIEDIAQDPQFGTADVCTKYGMRSYRGVPITSAEGHVLGTVVTMSDQPGQKSEMLVEALTDIATITMRELRLRRLLSSARAKQGPGAAARSPAFPQELLRGMTRDHLKILSTIKDGIIGVNREGTVNFVNPAAEKLLARPASSLLGKGFKDAVRASLGEDANARRPCQVLVSVQDGVEKLVRQESFQKGDGTAIPVEYASSPLKVGSDVVGAIISFRDMRAGTGANGVELRNALREVARLKNQIAMVERMRPAPTLHQHNRIDPLPAPPLVLNLPHAEMAARIRQEEADQIMRAMMLAANVIEGELGAASLLGLDPSLLRQKLQLIQGAKPSKRTSRLERWSN